MSSTPDLSKATPGPWAVVNEDHKNGDSTYRIEGPNGEVILDCSWAAYEGGGFPPSEYDEALIISARSIVTENQQLRKENEELKATINKMKVNNLRTIMEPVPEDEFNAIIDAIETRAMAADGPITPTLKEATEEELSKLWELIQEISPKRKRLQVLAHALDNATQDEAVREYLRFEGLDPDQVGREGSVFVKTVHDKIILTKERDELREALEIGDKFIKLIEDRMGIAGLYMDIQTIHAHYRKLANTALSRNVSKTKQ